MYGLKLPLTFLIIIHILNLHKNQPHINKPSCVDEYVAIQSMNTNWCIINADSPSDVDIGIDLYFLAIFCIKHWNAGPLKHRNVFKHSKDHSLASVALNTYPPNENWWILTTKWRLWDVLLPSFLAIREPCYSVLLPPTASTTQGAS